MTISDDEDEEADITIIDNAGLSLLFLADPDIAVFNNHTQVVSKINKMSIIYYNNNHKNLHCIIITLLHILFPNAGCWIFRV